MRGILFFLRVDVETLDAGAKYTIRILDDAHVVIDLYQIILKNIFNFDEDAANKLAIKLKTSGSITINNISTHSLNTLIEKSVDLLGHLGLTFSYQIIKNS